MECRTHGLRTRRSAVAVKACKRCGVPHSRPPDAPIGCGGEGLRCCTRLCAVRCSEQRLYSTWRRQRGALQLLWFRCKPLGYCQAGLEMRLEPTARPNAAATSADTDEHGRACVGGVGGVGPYVLRLEDQSQHQQQPAHMRRAVCMRRVHHLQAQADDVTALWSAALTASRRADWLWR